MVDITAWNPQNILLVILGLAHPLVFAAIAIHCLRTRREAAATVAWLFVAWSLPFVGPVLYLAFGINHVEAKGWAKQQSNDRLLTERHSREGAALPLAYWRAVRAASTARAEIPHARALDRTLERVLPDCPLLSGNRVAPLVTGDEAFPRMLEAIDNATHHIHLQTYIFGNDRTGREFMEHLRRKAQEGVRCRVLFDRFGSTWSWTSGLFRRYRDTPNLEIVGWTQANPVRRQFMINLRNHKKLLVIDGREAFVGGINLHDGHASGPARPPIRDYHFSVAGPVVLELQYTFLRDWYYMTNEQPAALLTEEHFPNIEPAGNTPVRLVNGGPTADIEVMTDTLCAAINTAHHELLVVTPYFVPPVDIFRALRLAALRGVNVQLVVPARNNHVYAGLAGQALYQELLEAGVRVQERQPPFLHAKAMIIDDYVSIVGTTNLDNRSLRLNYETNMVVFDDTFANQLKRIVLEDVARSRSIDLNAWRTRPLYHKVAENLCSLLSPLL